MELNEIRAKIQRGIPGAMVELTGENAHYRAVVVSEGFAGKSKVEQHRMVYATVREELASQEVHALALATFTPAEWERDQHKQER